MKKRLMIMLTTAALTYNAHVMAETKYKGTDDSATTRICLAAANEGFDAAEKRFKAEKMARVSRIDSIKCNGMSVKAFAALSYEKNNPTQLALKSQQK